MRPRGATLSIIPLAVTALFLAGFLTAPPLRVPSAPTPNATLIVLGAAQYDGRPSPAFQRRLDHALTLYQQGHVQRVVVTGGRQPGDRYTEGRVGATYLNAHGVPGRALIAEERSRTTVQNLENARAVLPGGTPVTLVTDEAHAPRALALARALNMNANVSASPLSPHTSRQYVLREKLALLGYALLGIRL
ncbi:YdcF family protein [Deinococcus actinosclerus]|uniref:DUF218 domain-containing protein n=1 Tax=Deinococcus actinosclerus TaxID=1768108 RepID=A0ABM5X386_9DEIO|nr:YdcF family protein [Deinococcus actinosclerus]ALW88153.1 hypothetical protein AUC44_03955 [Deinococcus actinosclerus]